MNDMDRLIRQCISIHAPTRGVTKTSRLDILDILFQSTPLREGRPTNPNYEEPDTSISIHAPTRGATLQSMLLSLAHFISIHAPTRGATSRLF